MLFLHCLTDKIELVKELTGVMEGLDIIFYE